MNDLKNERGLIMNKLKQFIEKNTIKYISNKNPTSESYKHPDVQKMAKEELEKGEKYFYPYFDDNGVIINKPDVKYSLKMEWSEDEYREFYEQYFC